MDENILKIFMDDDSRPVKEPINPYLRISMVLL